ncbi:low affinity iron permease family protein [Lentzea indica]|nr:low affinity iron permease family protein [Lentzea indica]
MRVLFSHALHRVVAGAGAASTGVAAVAIVLAWVVVGVVAGFSEGWHTVLWSVCSAVTFLMVFLIQHTTDRQSRAVLLKLDELIRIHGEARDEVIAVETRSLAEQDRLEDQMTSQRHAGRDR